MQTLIAESKDIQYILNYYKYGPEKYVEEDSLSVETGIGGSCLITQFTVRRSVETVVWFTRIPMATASLDKIFQWSETEIQIRLCDQLPSQTETIMGAVYSAVRRGPQGTESQVHRPPPRRKC